MSLFKKEKEKAQTVATASAEENPNTAIPADDANVEAPVAEAKALTPEEQREKSLVKMLITLDPTTFQVKVDNVQNLTRGFARYMAGVTHETYKNDEQANLTVMKLIDTLTKAQDGKKIWVPGSK